MRLKKFLAGLLALAVVFAVFPVTIISKATIGDFIAVENITGVPVTGSAGDIISLLNVVVEPANATNKTITWTANNGAVVNGNQLTFNQAGEVTLIAIITNGVNNGDYMQQFKITVSNVAVTGFTNIPISGTVNTPLVFTGVSVLPANATNKNINWSVFNAGGTGAVITNNILTATTAGTVTVTAASADGNYSQQFNIIINPGSHIPVTDITNIPTTAVAGTALNLGGTVVPSNATNRNITWSRVSGPAATFNGNMVTATAAGTLVVRAAITNGRTPTADYTKDFTITVTSNFIAATDITGMQTNYVAGTNTLSGTVAPANATNKNITWTVQNAGSTGASISGSNLTTTAAGTAVIRATITNGRTLTTDFTKDFTVTVTTSSQITSAAITNIPTPAAYNPPTRTITMPANSNFTVTNVEWRVTNNNNTGAVLGSSSNFAVSTRYTANITLTAKQGFTFANNFTATVNGAAATIGNRNNANTTIVISRAFPDATKAANQLPSAPQTFAVEPQNGQARLTWTAPLTIGGSELIRYEYSFGATQGYTTRWESIPSSNGNTVSYIVPNLANGTEYTFEVRAVNRSNGSGLSSGTKRTTPTGSASAPLNFNISSGNKNVTLTWTAPSFTGSNRITGYQVSYDVKGNYAERWIDISGGSNTTSFIVEHLDNGVEYTFEIRAVNDNGEGASSGKKDGTPSATVISPPRGFTVTAASESVVLSWQAPSSNANNITGYEYSFGMVNAGGTYTVKWTAVPSSNANTTNYTVTNLTAGSNYAFEVRAVGSGSNNRSGTSGVKLSTPTDAPPPNTSTSSVGNRKADITTAANANNNRNVDITMAQGSTSIPKDVLDIIKGKDVKLTLDFGAGGKIAINGKDINNSIASSDLDLSPRRSASTNNMLNGYNIPKTYIETYKVPVHQFKIGGGSATPVHGTATVNIGRDYAGRNAILCGYDTNEKAFRFISGCEINSNGEAVVSFDRTGDFAFIIQKTGDINGDNEIGTDDALTILKAVVGTITLDSIQKYTVSSRRDNSFDTNDALNILKLVVGQISKI